MRDLSQIADLSQQFSTPAFLSRTTKAASGKLQLSKCQAHRSDGEGRRRVVFQRLLELRAESLHGVTLVVSAQGRAGGILATHS